MPVFVDHQHIYLAPPCCASDSEGRQWCEDDVWPCHDCPNKHEANPPHGIRYTVDQDQSSTRK